jgi:pyrrolidone-carboxylate peptidase
LIVLTGFGPFANYKENISCSIIQSLKFNNNNLEIKKLILSVNWKYSINKYKKFLNKQLVLPQFVILLGIHSKRYYLMESYAWNFAFGNDIDNHIKFGFIKWKLNLWLKTQFNIDKILSILSNRINIKCSYFPGFYLCNYIYYWAILLSRKQYPVLFIHIPQDENLKNGTEIIYKIIQNISKYFNRVRN